MKKDDVISAIAMRMKILHLQDFNHFIANELPLNYLLEKLAETALETVDLEGMLAENDWENEDEQA